MSKVICEFCGTSYPETASQCPICGSVRSNDNNEIMGILEETSTEHEYHYVKGGRFSEKNVRKRNASRKRTFPKNYFHSDYSQTVPRVDRPQK